jgi:predicted DsbA family dithiol-disulfide isomerase
MAQWAPEMRAAFAEAGLCAYSEDGVVSSSLGSHRLLALAEREGKHHAVAEALFEAYCPGRPGRLSALSVFLCKSVFYGAFVWSRRALNRPKRRFPARAVCAKQNIADEAVLAAAAERAGLSGGRRGALEFLRSEELVAATRRSAMEAAALKLSIPHFTVSELIVSKTTPGERASSSSEEEEVKSTGLTQNSQVDPAV